MKGIEPSYAAWEAAVLPLNYTRDGADSIALRDKRRAGPLTQANLLTITAFAAAAGFAATAWRANG